MLSDLTLSWTCFLLCWALRQRSAAMQGLELHQEPLRPPCRATGQEMERSCQGLPPHRATLSWHPPTGRNTSASFIQWPKEMLHLWADSSSFRGKLVQTGPLSCACAEAEHSRDQVSPGAPVSHGLACNWCQISNPCFLWGQLKGDKKNK